MDKELKEWEGIIAKEMKLTLSQLGRASLRKIYGEMMADLNTKKKVGYTVVLHNGIEKFRRINDTK